MKIKRTFERLVVYIMISGLTVQLLYPTCALAKVRPYINRITIASPQSLRIVWDEFPDAKEYLLYQSAKNKKQFKLCVRTNKHSFVNKGLSLGITYFYKLVVVLQDNQMVSSPVINKKIPVRPRKPDFTVKVIKNKKSYSARLYLKNVKGAKYIEIRCKTSKKSKFYKFRFLKRINQKQPVKSINMGGYKTIYLQIRTYNKKGIYSKYSRLAKIRRKDYKKSIPAKESSNPPSSISSPEPDVPSAILPDSTPQVNPPTISPAPAQTSPSVTEPENEFTVSVSADTYHPVAYQTVKISAVTSSKASAVTVSSKSGNKSYGPFSMSQSGNLTWYFNAEFFDVGEHEVMVTAYSNSGETATDSLKLTVTSLFPT